MAAAAISGTSSCSEMALTSCSVKPHSNAVLKRNHPNKPPPWFT